MIDLNPIQPICIAGEWRAGGGDLYESLYPATGEAVARLHAASLEDVEEAMAGAHRAFRESGWAQRKPHERATVLYRIAALIRERSEELAQLQRLDNGKPIRETRNLVASAAATFQFFAAACETLEESITPSRGDFVSMSVYEPMGVVVAITPWNSPIASEAQKLAPALAAGNSVVLKPAEQSPFSALRLAELALEAGVPEGVLNVVPGLGEQAGKALGLHPEVDALVFTGSTEVGKYFMQYSAQSNLKQVWLECGGKSPNLVFADCRDLDLAAEKAAFGIFFNQGEVCSANSRLLVERSIHDEFVERLLAKARDWQPGDPLDPASRAGAIVDRRQTAGILAAIERAQGEGATLLGGGRQLTINGSDNFIEPTLFGDVRPDMQLAREEIFGPVLAISAFDSEDEAIRLANDSRYGLAASLWSDDLHRAHRVARRLNAGTVSVNTVDALDVAVPFGGGKQSGFGRDLSLHSFDKYTQLKTTWFQLR